MQTRTAAVTVAAAFLALALCPAAHAQTPREERQFCAAVDEFRSASEPLRVVGPGTRAADARAAMGNLAAASDAMERTTNRPNTPSARRLRDAIHRLERDLGTTSPAGTLGPAAASIRTDASVARDYAHQVALETGCPEGKSPDVMPVH